MDGIVVAGHHRKRTHIHGRREGDVAATTPRGVGGVLRYRATGPNRVAEFSGSGTAQDREPLFESGDRRTVGPGNCHRDRHHTTHVGVGGIGSRCRNGQLGRNLGQIADHASRMVEVDQAEQPLHHRHTAVGHRGTDRCENRRPALPDQCVRNGCEARCQRLTESGRDPGVVGHLLGVPVDGHRRRSIGYRGQ